MRLHGRPHYGQRLLVKAFSSCKSIGSSLLTRIRKPYRKLRTTMRNSFLATKSATITSVRSFWSDIGKKSHTYTVGDTDSTSSAAESGADPTDPECAQGAHEGLSRKRPRDSLKRKAPTSADSQPAKRAAVEMPDICSKGDNLSPDHLLILKSKGGAGFLDDDIISMAQELLQSQFEGFDGLQPPAALMVPGYCALKDAVQIHYDQERVHWLTTCFKDGKIMVADSIKSGCLTPSIRQQIINMYSDVINEPLKNLSFLNVDQQRNGYDCGVFAIAFAYELLADGGDPRAVFQHQKMREHLISCLQNGRISGFPKVVGK